MPAKSVGDGHQRAGEIEILTAIAEPDIGGVTTVSDAIWKSWVRWRGYFREKPGAVRGCTTRCGSWATSPQPS